jgi:hypothetical protein
MSKLTPEHDSRHPDSDSYFEVTAAYKYVDSVLSTADAQSPVNGLAWHGWALREAFLAGCTHAAEQLRTTRRPTPQPVAVGERLPGPEDCDAEGRCWGWWTDPMSEYWEYVGVSAPIEPYGSYIPRAGHTHWLPANALPTPEAKP